ncbi:IclR family transcriptional regulator C-terminal domain-containing protein [Roseomonas sp. E05]|uniref:IclR family transcriptional regulator domain-containing protein n=1 Tax=Roseomonas sp. E05 TaxID=3046310 RepID=UPI0024BAB1E8|nr:IclR family transcriptional regulator C-terminal domain-containing protein [Roseomonas sp. E05]MDJ0387473.1 IclR family transcriptional regulator C-terminal domain-containing protein [Roseomonas sp. E05]
MSQPRATQADAGRQGREFVNALERGLAVLATFGRGRERMTLSHVAQMTGLSRGTARRLLLTLSELNYVASDGKLFWLTPKVLHLGQGYLASFGRGEVATAIIKGVSEKLGESCSMAVLDGPDIVYVARVETQRVFSSRIDIGTRLPAHCSSLGRVLLAGLGEADLETWMARHPLHAWTEKTLVDPEKFRARIHEVRRLRYAIIDGELEVGSRSIAVPVLDRSDRTCAALNIGTSSARASLELMRRRFLPVLREAAQQIGSAIEGW